MPVAGTFGVASHRHGSPFLAEAWGGSAGAAYAIPWPWVGFPVAGLIAVGGYVLLVSLFFSVAGGAG